jgi:hypothetical protein
MGFCYSCKPFIPCTIHLPFHFFIILSSVMLLSLPFFLSSVCSVAVKAMEPARVATVSLSSLSSSSSASFAAPSFSLDQ